MNESTQHISSLRLKKREERRLRAGHMWVFSNEIDVDETPLTDFEPGEPVEIQDCRGKVVGAGYVNPHSLISARLISRKRGRYLSVSLIRSRLKNALMLRDRLYHAPYYRLLYGESDRLPGLVVDRYGDVLVVQITTAGMECFKRQIIGELERLLRPAGILVKNDSPVRQLEGLPLYTEISTGEVPDHVIVEENGVRFSTALQQGQKTGWFFDHRENRMRMRSMVRDQRVLDVFSYAGAWGVQAAVSGAHEVMCIDGSAQALEFARNNAELNKVGEKVTTLPGDAFKALKNLHEAGERFDVVILDPPAFIKRKKDIKEGLHAYHRLNELAIKVMNHDAILVSCSCSYRLTQHELVQQIMMTSRQQHRTMQILAFGQQGPDHPVHPAIPETNYLKAVFARVLA